MVCIVAPGNSDLHGEGHAMLHPGEKMIYLSNINPPIQRGSYVGM